MVHLETRLHLVVLVELEECETFGFAGGFVGCEPDRGGRELTKVCLELVCCAAVGEVADEANEA